MDTVIALMKKDETRKFEVVSLIDGVTTIREIKGEGEFAKPKEMARKSFIKGYKLIEGSLDDVTSEAPEIPAEGPQDGYVTSVTVTNPQNVLNRLVTVELNTPIESVREDELVAELVNNHGMIHGDKCITDEGSLGWVDLNGDGPSFHVLNPPLLISKTVNGEMIEDDGTVTMIYAKSGKQVTMTHAEFYSKTHAVTMKENGDTLQEDPLPSAMSGDDKPPLTWATVAKPTETTDMISEALPPVLPLVQVWDAFNAMVEEEEARNSMRASRDAKADSAKPFVPEPFFLRQSMISSYLQCPDKMYDTYENGYKEESIFTRVGTAIHGLMEDFYNDRTIDIDETFDKWWASNSTPEYDWYKDWKKFVARYFAKEAKYEKPQVIATELEFRTTINGVPCSGTIDRVDRVDDQTIRLVDYKTNFRAFSDAELQESIQFMKYTSAIQTPELRQMLRDKGDSGEFSIVICTYEMLRLGYRQTVIFDADEIAIFQKWMKTIWTMILSGTNRQPKLNQYCGYCQKRQRCGLYMETLNAPISSILTENTDIEAVVGERERLTMNAKLIKNRLDEIEEQIKAKIMENQGALVIGEYEWGTKSSTRSIYPAQDVFRILAMNGLGNLIPDLVNVSKTSLDRVLKDNKVVMDLIEEKKVATYTKPSLNKKKVKPVKE